MRFNFWQKGSIRHAVREGKLAAWYGDSMIYEEQLFELFKEKAIQVTKKAQSRMAELQLADQNAERTLQRWTTAEIQGMQREVVEATKRVAALKKTLTGQLHLAKKKYRIVIGGIAIAEVPLISIVFEIVGLTKVETYAVAAVLSILNVIAAHLLGALLAQRSFTKEKILSLRGCSIIALAGTSTAAMLGIAYVRKLYIEGQGVSELLGVLIEPTAVMLVFLSINLLLQCVATVASIVMHDFSAKAAQEGLPEALSDLEKRRKELDSIIRSRDEAQKILSEAAITMRALENQTSLDLHGLKQMERIRVLAFRHEYFSRAGNPHIRRVSDDHTTN